MLLTAICAQPAGARSSPAKSEKNGRASLPLLQASHQVTNTAGTTTRISRLLLLVIGYLLFFLGAAAVLLLCLNLIASCVLLLFPFDLGIIPPLSGSQVWRGTIKVGIVRTALFILFVSPMLILGYYRCRSRKDIKRL
jgi:hypothetical protein